MLSTIRLASVLAVLATAAAGCATADDLSFDDTSVGTSAAESSVRGGFELWRADDGQYYFHLEAGNYQILLSSEGYESRTGALNGVLAILDNAGLDSRYHIAQGGDAQFYVSLSARNGEIVGTSEGYATREGAENLIVSTQKAVGAYLEHWDTNTGARFEVFEGRGGEYRFNLHAHNGEIVLSSEGYSSEAAALNGAFVVSESGLDAASYEVRDSANGGAYLLLKAANGEIVGTSEIYTSRSSARAARDAIIDLIPDAELL